MKRILIFTSLLCLIIMAGLVPGCSCSNDTSTNPDGSGGGGTEGKAQALVFSTPT